MSFSLSPSSSFCYLLAPREEKRLLACSIIFLGRGIIYICSVEVSLERRKKIVVERTKKSPRKPEMYNLLRYEV